MPPLRRQETPAACAVRCKPKLMRSSSKSTAGIGAAAKTRMGHERRFVRAETDPMVGSFAGCASTAIDQDAAAPPRSVMNSRRFN